jgi:hypothetical protein
LKHDAEKAPEGVYLHRTTEFTEAMRTVEQLHKLATEILIS